MANTSSGRFKKGSARTRRAAKKGGMSSSGSMQTPQQETLPNIEREEPDLT